MHSSSSHASLWFVDEGRTRSWICACMHTYVPKADDDRDARRAGHYWKIIARFSRRRVSSWPEDPHDQVRCGSVSYSRQERERSSEAAAPDPQARFLIYPGIRVVWGLRKGRDGMQEYAVHAARGRVRSISGTARCISDSMSPSPIKDQLNNPVNFTIRCGSVSRERSCFCFLSFFLLRARHFHAGMVNKENQHRMLRSMCSSKPFFPPNTRSLRAHML